MTWLTKPPIGTQLDVSHPLNNGLVAYWLFNENAGNTVSDLINNNIGTFINIASPSNSTSGWNPGRLGPSIVLDGIDDYINVPKNPSINITSGTISIWMKNYTSTTNDDGQMPIMRCESFSWARLIYGIVHRYYGWIVYIGTSANVIAALSYGQLSINQWHNLVFTFQYTPDTTSTELRLYNNGVFVGTATGISQVGSGILGYGTSYERDLGIGGKYNGGNHFNGEIDEVRIWNRVLTDAEISTLYSSPYVMFLEGTCPQVQCDLTIT